MSGSLSRNNVKLHFSDLPNLFSEKLKTFFSRQYAFNDEVTTLLENNQKVFTAITQKLGATEKELNQLKQEITRLRKSAGG